jgi:hypothetical protein
VAALLDAAKATWTELRDTMRAWYKPIFDDSFGTFSDPSLRQMLSQARQDNWNFWFKYVCSYLLTKRVTDPAARAVDFDLEPMTFSYSKDIRGKMADRCQNVANWAPSIASCIRMQLRTDGVRADGLIRIHNLTHPGLDFTPLGAWSPMGLSMGLAKGVAFTSCTCYFRYYALVCHEFGHTVFLNHAFGADSMAITEHDYSDKNCLMGYPLLDLYDRDALVAPDARGFVEKDVHAEQHDATKRTRAQEGLNSGNIVEWKNFRLPKYFFPHFCGKCNLRLRGWNVFAGGNEGAKPDGADYPVKLANEPYVPLALSAADRAGVSDGLPAAPAAVP